MKQGENTLIYLRQLISIEKVLFSMFWVLCQALEEWYFCENWAIWENKPYLHESGKYKHQAKWFSIQMAHMTLNGEQEATPRTELFKRHRS